MCFVSDEVVEKVDEVSRKVLPGCRRDRPTTRCAEADHVNNAFAAAFKSTRQVGWFNCSGVDSPRHRDAMLRADHLDPHAPGIVKVCCNGANSAARRAGNAHGPQLGRQVLDEIHRHPMAGVSRVDQHFDGDLHGEDH